MPQLDTASFPTQIFWLAVTFIALYALMTWVALPRIARILAERRTRIVGDLDTAEQMKAEAETVLRAYERVLAEARAQAQQTLKEAGDRLAAQAAERQRQVAGKLAAETAAAERRIEAARAQALGNLREIAIDVARSAAAKLAGDVLDGAAAPAAVDAVLQERR